MHADRNAEDPPRPGHRRPERARWWWLTGFLTVAALLAGTLVVAMARSGSTPVVPAADPAPEHGTSPRPVPGGPGTPLGVAGMGQGSASPSPSASPTPKPQAGVTRTKTLPGASIYVLPGETFATALARSDRTYGPLRMVRVFYPGLPPAWPGSRADVANRTVVVSFKAPPQEVLTGKHDSRLAGWFRSIPTDHDVYWTYFHEPENDVESGAYTTAQFRAAWRRIAGLAQKVDNHRLKATLILMCWTLNPQSNRKFDDYWPGGDVIDVLGWDCYNSGGRYGRYTHPENTMPPLIAKSRALGKPWGIAETGSVRIPGDQGAGRAAWIRDLSRYLNGHNPLWVAYYDYEIDGNDYRLMDRHSQQAWQEYCRAAA